MIAAAIILPFDPDGGRGVLAIAAGGAGASSKAAVRQRRQRSRASSAGRPPWRLPMLRLVRVFRVSQRLRLADGCAAAAGAGRRSERESDRRSSAPRADGDGLGRANGFRRAMQ
jgi:hypothetical protein